MVVCTEVAARLADMAPRGSDDGGGIVKSPYSPGTYFVQKQEWVVRARYTSTYHMHFSGCSIPTLPNDVLHMLYLFRKCSGIISVRAVDGLWNTDLSCDNWAAEPMLFASCWLSCSTWCTCTHPADLAHALSLLQLGERYELVRLLGSGSFSSVCMCIDSVTGERVSSAVWGVLHRTATPAATR